MALRSLFWGLGLFLGGAFLGYGFQKAPMPQAAAEKRLPASSHNSVGSRDMGDGITCFYLSGSDQGLSCVKTR